MSWRESAMKVGDFMVWKECLGVFKGGKVLLGDM
jgi:hypothetical protein